MVETKLLTKYMKGTIKMIRALQLLTNHINDREVVAWILRERKKLRRFENKHFGERCFIIGNGPSLNQMDLSKLKGVTTFGLNKIYLHPDFDKIGISYHVAVNPLVVQQSMNVFRGLGVPSFLSYRACKNVGSASPLTYYLMTKGGPDYFSKTPYNIISEGGTVTYVALQLAYFMGFEEVFLIGVDHNFLATGKPNEKQVLKGPDVNHFHPDYFSGQEWHLPDLEASEIAYRLAKFHYRLANRKIVDATFGGKLAVYEKVYFEEALNRCKKSS